VRMVEGEFENRNAALTGQQAAAEAMPIGNVEALRQRLEREGMSTRQIFIFVIVSLNISFYR